MVFYKIETFKDGSQSLYEAPINYTLEDGSTVLNFYLVADKYGWKPLVKDIIPSYDNSYQKLVMKYEETETNILQHWQVVEMMPLDDFKQSKIDEFDEYCTKQIEAGFISLGYQFAFSLPKDQVNFTQQLVDILNDPSITTVEWKTEDQGVQTFTVEQFKQIVADAKAHKLSNIQHFWDIKLQIQAAITFDEVLSIAW